MSKKPEEEETRLEPIDANSQLPSEALVTAVLNRFRFLDVDNKHCVCAICADGGDLVLCDGPSCPLVFHAPCLVSSGFADPTQLSDDVRWLCPRCIPDFEHMTGELPFDSAICSFERIERAQARISQKHSDSESDSDSSSSPAPPSSSNEPLSKKRKRKDTFFFSRSGETSHSTKTTKTKKSHNRLFRGIIKESNGWRVAVSHDKGKIYIGKWLDQLEAATAWDVSNLLVKSHLGKKIKLNFPDKLEEYDILLQSGYQPDEHADIPPRDKPLYPIYSPITSEFIKINNVVSDGDGLISSKQPSFSEFIAGSGPKSTRNNTSSSSSSSSSSSKRNSSSSSSSSHVIGDIDSSALDVTDINDGDSEIDPLPSQFGDDRHMYYCRLCDNKGSDARLVLCEGCPRVFHHRCVPTMRTSSLSLKWICPVCISVGRGWSGRDLDIHHLSVSSTETFQSQVESISPAISLSVLLLFRKMRSRGSISAIFEPSFRHVAVLVARAFSEDDSIAAECALADQTIVLNHVSDMYLYSRSIVISALCLEPLPSSELHEPTAHELEIQMVDDGTLSAMSDLIKSSKTEAPNVSQMEWDELFEKDKDVIQTIVNNEQREVSSTTFTSTVEVKKQSNISSEKLSNISSEKLSNISSEKLSNISSDSLYGISQIISEQQVSHTLVFEPVPEDARNFASMKLCTHESSASLCLYCKCKDPDAICTSCSGRFHLMCDEDILFHDVSNSQKSSQVDATYETLLQDIRVDNTTPSEIDNLKPQVPLACTACSLRSRIIRHIENERNALIKDTNEFLASTASWRTLIHDSMTPEACAAVAEQASRSISNRTYRLSCLRALWAVMGASASDTSHRFSSFRFGDAFPFLTLPPPLHKESKSFFFSAGGSEELGSFSSYAIVLDRLVSGVYDVDPPELRVFVSIPTKNSRIRAQVQARVDTVDIAHKSPSSVLRLPSIQSFVTDMSNISCNAALYFGKQENIWDSSSSQSHRKIGANAALVHHATVVAIELALLSGACTVLSATVAALSGFQNKSNNYGNIHVSESLSQSHSSQEDKFIEALSTSFVTEILSMSKELSNHFKISLEKAVKEENERKREVLPSNTFPEKDFGQFAMSVVEEFNEAICIVQSRKKRSLNSYIDKKMEIFPPLFATIESRQIKVRLLGLDSNSHNSDIVTESSFKTRSSIEAEMKMLLNNVEDSVNKDSTSVASGRDKIKDEQDDMISLRPNNFDWLLAAQLRDAGVSLEASMSLAKGISTDSISNFVSPIDEAFLNLAFPKQSSEILGPQVIPGVGLSHLVPDLSGDFTCIPVEEKFKCDPMTSIICPKRDVEKKSHAVFRGDPLRCDGCRYGWKHVCSYAHEQTRLANDGRIFSKASELETFSSSAHEILLSSLKYSQNDSSDIQVTEQNVLQQDVHSLRSSFLRSLALQNHRILTSKTVSEDATSRLTNDRKLVASAALHLQLSILPPRDAKHELSLFNDVEEQEILDTSSSVLVDQSSEESLSVNVSNGVKLQKDSIQILSQFHTDSIVATHVLATANLTNPAEPDYLNKMIMTSQIFDKSQLGHSFNEKEDFVTDLTLPSSLLPGTEDAFFLSEAIKQTSTNSSIAILNRAILHGALYRSISSVDKLGVPTDNRCARLRPYYGRRSFYPRNVAKQFYQLSASHESPVLSPSPHLQTLSPPLLQDRANIPEHMKWICEDQPSIRSLEARARWSLTRLALGTSRIDGIGLFALENIEPEDVIIEYTGEVISETLCNLRQAIYQKSGLADYMFRTGADEVIDATVHGCRARYINHSCDPNCFAVVTLPELYQHGKGRRVFVYSKRRILIGEELTYDYCFSTDEGLVRCLCGMSACRGHLNV